MLSLEEALDESLSRLERGQPLSQVLYRYPAQASSLKPLLQTAERLWRARPPRASREAYEDGRARMFAALDRKGRVPQLRRDRLHARRRFAWAVSLGGAALTLLIVGWFVLRYAGLQYSGLSGDGSDDHTAKVATIVGTAERLRTQAAAWEPLDVGDTVFPGDRVRTTADSSAELRFADGVAADLRANTEIAVLQVAESATGGTSSTVIYLEQGEAAYQIPASGASTALGSRFEVHTASAVAVPEAPGRFSMAVTPGGATLLEADTSRVAMTTASGETRTVHPGQSAGATSPSSRPELPPGQERKTPTPTATPKPAQENGPPSSGGSPPGHSGGENQPPGQSDKDHEPPGQSDKDHEPPGQSGEDHQPPGQSGKDK